MGCPTLRFNCSDDLSMWSFDGGPISVDSDAVLWACVHNGGENGPARTGRVQFSWQQKAGAAITPITLEPRLGHTDAPVGFGGSGYIQAKWRPTIDVVGPFTEGQLWATASTESIPTVCPANNPDPHVPSIYTMQTTVDFLNPYVQDALIFNPPGVVLAFAIARGEGSVTVRAESLGLLGMDKAETFLSVVDAKHGAKVRGVLGKDHASLIERHQSEKRHSSLEVELDPNREIQALLSVSFQKAAGEWPARCLADVRVTHAGGPVVDHFLIGLQTDAKNPVWF